MIELRYIVLHLLLVIVLFIFSNRLACVSLRAYWKYAVIPIAVFTLEEGLRWGREIDWCVYYGVYSDLKANIFTGHEPLFTAIWWTFAHVGAEYYVLIAFCSFLLAFSIFFMFKPYKEINTIAIPFAFLMIMGVATNLIRWFMGVSFLLIAIRYYLDHEKKKAVLFAIAACCTHIALLVAIPLILFPMLKKNRILAPKTAIVISVILTVFFDRNILGNFSFVFDLFDFYTRFVTYKDSAAEWLTGEASKNATEQMEYTELLVRSIPLYFFIYYGYKAIERKKSLMPIWNTMVVGIFLRNIAKGLELLGRYIYIYDILMCIGAGYAILYIIGKRNKNAIDVLGLLFIGIFIARKIYVFCIPNYDAPELKQYIWDMQTDPSILIYHFYLK